MCTDDFYEGQLFFFCFSERAMQQSGVKQVPFPVSSAIFLYVNKKSCHAKRNLPVETGSEAREKRLLLLSH